jgi:hypothetical protein
MASLVAKKKGHKLYYYVVDSARVDGQPRIVHQTYLGSAEKSAALVKDRTAPVPVAATVRAVGVPGALWRAATESGVFDVLSALWPAPRSGPSIAHYLLLAAWYDRTILPTLWHFRAARFTSQAFWDAFDQIAMPEGDADAPDDLPAVLPRVTRLLDEAKIARDSVTLVFDKGTAALTNTVALREAGVGWVSALPWNQAPPDLRTRPLEDVPACSADHPGVRAAGQLAVVHGDEALCVLQYSAAFASEQLHSLTTSLTTVLQRLRRLASDLRKPGCRLTEAVVRGRIDRWLSPAFLPEIVRWEWRVEAGHGRLQFDVDHHGLQQILAARLGRTVLITNRRDWSAEQVVAAYGGQQQLEQVFRGLKDGDWLGWGPMHHWTDSKIRVHAFYGVLGISLLKYLQREAQAAWPGLSVDQLLEELREIQQVVLLYPPQGEKGPCRTASVLTKQTLPQQLLVTTLGLDRLGITPQG